MLIISETINNTAAVDNNLRANQQTAEAIQEQLCLVLTVLRQSHASLEALLSSAHGASTQSDAVVASIQELHALLVDLKHQRSISHQALQYAQIQDRINDFKDAMEGEAMAAAISSDERYYMLFKSRSGMTRTLIGAMDNFGASFEDRFVTGV